MPLVLLIGGARSGKSRLAVQLAQQREPVVFLATGEARDEEMRERIGQFQGTLHGCRGQVRVARRVDSARSRPGPSRPMSPVACCFMTLP